MLAVLSTLNPEHALFAKSYRPPRPERVAAAQIIQDDHGFFEGLPTAKNASKRKASRVTFVDTQTANRLRRKELEKRAAAIEKQLKLHRAHDEQHRLGGRHVYEDEDEEVEEAAVVDCCLLAFMARRSAPDSFFHFGTGFVDLFVSVVDLGGCLGGCFRL